MKRNAWLPLLSMLSLLCAGNSFAATAEFETACTQGMRQIASVWGSPAMDAHIAKDFSGDKEQFAIPASDAGLALRLEVVTVDQIQKLGSDECEARVSVRFVKPQPDHSVVEVSPPVSGKWKIRLPDLAASNTDNARFNGSEENGLEGIAMLRVYWELPTDQREVLLELEQAVADNISADEENENAVQFPLQPAAGWLVRLGEQETMTESDGSFTLSGEIGDAREGEIVNPATGVVFKTFSIDQLVATDSGEPPPIVVNLQSHGSCGMDGDNPAHCGQ